MNPRHIYLSAQWARRDEIASYAARLRDVGHIVTSRWPQGEPMGSEQSATVEDWRQWAVADLADIRSSNTFIAFTEPQGTQSRGGRHAEWGYAVAAAWVDSLIVVGPVESQFYALATRQYDTVDAWLADALVRTECR